MDENKNRAAEQLPDLTASPSSLVNDMLSDLEETAAGFPTVPIQPVQAPAAPVAAPVQPQTAPVQQAAAPSEPLEQEETELSAPEPEDDAPEASEEDAEPLYDDEQAPEYDEAEEQPYDEIEDELELIEDDYAPADESEADVTAGMGFIERIRYHTRMRRREQTRLRRENARRGNTDPYQPMSRLEIRFTLIRLGIAAALLMVGLLLDRFIQIDTIPFIFFLGAYLLTVLPIAATVARNFTHGRYFDEYLLIFVASVGAFLLERQAEASIVLILHGIGKMISDTVLSSTATAPETQIDTLPELALVVNMKGEQRQVAPSEVRPGEFVLVRSGEYVPVDGIVLRGEGTVDDTALTGEPEPWTLEKGSYVLAGSRYEGSLLLLRTTARFEDSALSQIRHIQSESAERKASLEGSVAYGATRIVPAVVVLAVLMSVIPPLFNSATSIANWVYRALTILVVSCPTALVISVPLSFNGGNGRLTRKGIHIKGGEAIEKMAELRMVVFDKTGTLTEGNLHVKEIQSTRDFNQESILALAAAAEQFSRHPAARAVVSAYPSVPQKISEFEEFPGRGVRARIGNHNLLVGNRRLMVSRGVKGVPSDISGTVVYVAYEGDYAGAIVLEDTIRKEASEAIAGLKNQGVLRTVILTGDTEVPAQQTASAIGIDTIHHGLLPDEKASKMEFLLRTIPTDGTAAYVGDGVNDLEELKMADIGVAMGAAGSRMTADAANVLIISSNLTRLTDALRISRKTHNIALQNMVLVLLIKLLLALLAVVGVTAMWQAIAADVLLTILTVLNAGRIMNIK